MSQRLYTKYNKWYQQKLPEISTVYNKKNPIDDIQFVCPVENLQKQEYLFCKKLCFEEEILRVYLEGRKEMHRNIVCIFT